MHPLSHVSMPGISLRFEFLVKNLTPYRVNTRPRRLPTSSPSVKGAKILIIKLGLLVARLFDPLSSTVDVGEMAGELPWTTNTSEFLAEEIKWKWIKTNQNRTSHPQVQLLSKLFILFIICLKTSSICIKISSRLR